MARKYRNYSDEDVIKYAKEVFSISGLLRKLDLVIAGGNFAHMKKTLQRLEVDTSHWTGAAWSKDQQLKDWQDYSKAANLKKHLLLKYKNTCQKCNLTIWQDEPIPLEVHHLDGDRTNNELENLDVLCCNCHAQTGNWRNKKRTTE
jgi:hypothetical protein